MAGFEIAGRRSSTVMGLQIILLVGVGATSVLELTELRHSQQIPAGDGFGGGKHGADLAS